MNKVLKDNLAQYGNKIIVDKKNSIIKCEGVAGFGTLKVNPRSIDFGHVQVGTSFSYDVEIFNTSDFSLQSYLKLDFADNDHGLSQVDMDKYLSFFKLSIDKCHIKSKIRKVFHIEFCPGTDCKVDMVLKVYVGDQESNSQPIIASSCTIKAIGE